MTRATKKDDDIPNEPLALTNLLQVCRMGLEAISAKLYDLGEEDVGMELDDGIATIEMVRGYCKDKKL